MSCTIRAEDTPDPQSSQLKIKSRVLTSCAMEVYKVRSMLSTSRIVVERPLHSTSANGSAGTFRLSGCCCSKLVTRVPHAIGRTLTFLHMSAVKGVLPKSSCHPPPPPARPLPLAPHVQISVLDPHPEDEAIKGGLVTPDDSPSNSCNLDSTSLMGSEGSLTSPGGAAAAVESETSERTAEAAAKVAGGSSGKSSAAARPSLDIVGRTKEEEKRWGLRPVGSGNGSGGSFRGMYRRYVQRGRECVFCHFSYKRTQEISPSLPQIR